MFNFLRKIDVIIDRALPNPSYDQIGNFLFESFPQIEILIETVGREYFLLELIETYRPIIGSQPSLAGRISEWMQSCCFVRLIVRPPLRIESTVNGAQLSLDLYFLFLLKSLD